MSPIRAIFRPYSGQNRQGGHILLGVDDDGSVSGVLPTAIKSIERNIVNVISDPNLFNSSPSLEFSHEEIDGKDIIDLWVPMGPSVYRFKGVVYDRAADVDMRVKSDERISRSTSASRTSTPSSVYTRT